jgi:hypothetical protein
LRDPLTDMEVILHLAKWRTLAPSITLAAIQITLHLNMPNLDGAQN